MPRRARLVLANTLMHIIQRGNNRQACFFANAHYLAYLGYLKSDELVDELIELAR